MALARFILLWESSMENDSLKLRAKDVGVIVAMIVWLAAMLVAQAGAHNMGPVRAAVAADQPATAAPSHK